MTIEVVLPSREGRIATEAEAVAGASATVMMTPLGVSQWAASNRPLFATVADLETASVPAVVMSFQIGGYYEEGDGGGGQRVRGVEGPGARQSGDGAWWEIGDKVVNVLACGAVVDSATEEDSSAAINEALSIGRATEFAAGVYYGHALTQATDKQRIFCEGAAYIFKNANGDLWTGSGDYVKYENILLYGDDPTPVFTGHNWMISGNHNTLVDCGGMWAYGRALKCTGEPIFIRGTSGFWATADQTATGYDGEIIGGLYHELLGINSGQATGGWLLDGTGSLKMFGGHIGKLTIKNTIAFPGANGGHYAACRITGNVSIGVSNAVFPGTMLGGSQVQIEAGVTGVDLSGCIFQNGTVVTNLGNGSNIIIRQSLGPAGYLSLRYGDDTNYYDVSYTLGEMLLSGGITLPNNVNIYQKNAAGTYLVLAGMSAGGIQTFGDSSNNFTQIVGNASIYMTIGGAARVQFIDQAIRPQTDNAVDLGWTGQRFRDVKAYVSDMTTSYSVGGTQVVGAQGAAVADATDAASAITQLNALLARCRAHGLIAT